MKKTLLEMVQSIMSSMDSDQVNSISDTAEAMQVAGYLRDSFYELVSGLNLPNTTSLFSLTAAGQPTQPTLMFMPDFALNVSWMRYNKATSLNGVVGDPLYEYVEFMPLEQFLQTMFEVGGSSSLPTNTGMYQIAGNYGAMPVYYQNDKPPSFYTTYDDHTILFDSYDSAVDTTLQGSKTICWGEIASGWVMADSFIPNLEDKMFQLLENEAKQQAFVEAKQSANPLATQRAHKGWVRARREKYGLPYQENARARTTTAKFGRTAWPLAPPGSSTLRNST